MQAHIDFPYRHVKHRTSVTIHFSIFKQRYKEIIYCYIASLSQNMDICMKYVEIYIQNYA